MSVNNRSTVGGSGGNSFQRNIFGNYEKDASVFSVLYGTDSYLLEDELNESQWATTERLAALMRNSYASGITKEYTMQFPYHENVFYIETIDSKPLSVLLDGYQLFAGNNNPNNLPEDIIPSDDKLIFKLKDSNQMQDRTDLVMLESWFEVINHKETIRKFGGENTPIMENNILDVRMSEETSRRIQFRWRIRVIENQTSIDGVKALTYDGKNSGVIYQELENNTYFANIGVKFDEEDSMKTGKLTYAIPLFSIKRPAGNNYIAKENVEVLSPVSNMGLMDVTVERNLRIKGNLEVDGVISANTKTFVFDQIIPSKTWSINHQLEKFPSVTIVDNAGNEVIGDIKYDSNKHLTVSFSTEFSGRVYLN